MQILKLVYKCVLYNKNQSREIKFEKYDESMLVLNECLRLIKGLSYFEQEVYTNFKLPRSVIKTYIKFYDSRLRTP